MITSVDEFECTSCKKLKTETDSDNCDGVCSDCDEEAELDYKDFCRD